MAGAIIAVSTWVIVLAWLVVTLLRAGADLVQQRQVEALDALAELSSASHRGGRTR